VKTDKGSQNPRTTHAQAIVDVHIVLMQGDRVLLGQRANTGFADGLWHLPAGHLEDGEPLPDAAAREAFEELGIEVETGTLELVHLMHQPGRIATFFTAGHWSGRIRNMEPHKCTGLAWFPLEALPLEMTPYCHAALTAIRAGAAFSTFGWAASGAEQAA
jgi:8-oxo-dGTP pyrophosphatase MutT (NUDIX family)